MLKQASKLLIVLLTAIGLMACTVSNPKLGNNNDEAIDKALQDGINANQKLGANQEKIPAAIQRALMPTPDFPLNLPGDSATTTTRDQQRFNISVNNVPAKEFFAGLIKNTRYNITVSPQVSGMVSLDLKNVTVPEVMDTVRDVYGFEYELTPSGYQVLPRHLATRVFTVNYLDMNRNGKSSTSFGSSELTDINNQNVTSSTTTSTATSPGSNQEIATGSSITTSSKSNFWDDLKLNLTAVIGAQEGRSVVVNSQSGMVIVHAYPDELRNVAEYLDSIQNSMNRQVVIEAQILEVQLNAQFQSGIDWKFLGFSQGVRNNLSSNTSSDTSTLSPNIPADFSGTDSLKISSGGTFQAFIKLLGTQGKVNVLSSPRITTTNNQKAVIKVGSDRFFVTNVTSNTVTSSSVGNNSQNIQLTPFFSGIALDVTPQINEVGEITLHIHPVISNVTLDQQKFTVNDQAQDLPLAKSTIRESDSVVRAQNGQVIAIGGLIQNTGAQYEAATPGTEHLGLFSALFKSQNRTATKSELIILLRPTMTGSSYNWNKNLREAAERFRDNKGDDFRYKVEKNK